MKNNVLILGTGAFGVSLASVCHDNGYKVTLWTKITSEYNYLIKERKVKSLDNYLLNIDYTISNNLMECLNNNDIIIIAIPTNYLTDVLKEVGKYDISSKYFCIASKGLGNDKKLLHEVFKENINTTNYSVISGPSFARDIISKNKTCLSFYANNDKIYTIIKNVLNNDYFSLERENDLISIELSGIIKNIYAIACGMLDGLNTSDTTKALFMTMALRELDCINKLFGGNSSILSLATFGDLFLTCSSKQSRNYSYGYLLAKNKEESNTYLLNNTVEGHHALYIMYDLLKEKNIDAKIINNLYNIIFNNGNIYKIVNF